MDKITTLAKSEVPNDSESQLMVDLRIYHINEDLLQTINNIFKDMYAPRIKAIAHYQMAYIYYYLLILRFVSQKYGLKISFLLLNEFPFIPNIQRDFICTLAASKSLDDFRDMINKHTIESKNIGSNEKHYDMEYNAQRLIGRLDRLCDKLKFNLNYRFIDTKLEKLNLTNLNGTIYNLKNENGLNHIIYFWSQQCEPCLANLDELLRMAGQPQKNICLVLCCIESSISKDLLFKIQKYKSVKVVYSDNFSELYLQTGIKSIPSALVIDDKLNIKLNHFKSNNVISEIYTSIIKGFRL